MARPRAGTVEAGLVLAGSAGLVLLYCLRNGTYDLVARGELSLLIWTALGLGWATRVLPREQPTRLLWPVVAGFLGLAIWTTICLSWTESDERTVIELGRVVHHAGVFLIAASVLTRASWRAALGGLTLGLVVVAWVGLANWLWPGSLAVDDIREVFGAQRLSYPLDYFNGMATLGAMTIVAALTWSTHAARWWLRALAILPVPGVVVMTYLTYSRGGALELAVGLLAVFAFARHRAATAIVGLVTAGGSALTILALRDRTNLVQGTSDAGSERILLYAVVAGVVAAGVAVLLTVVRADERLRLPRRIGRPALAGFAVIAVVAAAVATPTLVREAGESLDTAGVNSAENPTKRFTSLGGARIGQYRAALATWQQHRIEGTGPGTFEFAWDRSSEYDTFVRDVHNLYLEALAESGIPGLALLLVVLFGLAVLAVAAGVKDRPGPERGAATVAIGILAVFLAAGVVDWVWELTALPFVMLFAAGAAAAGLSRGRASTRFRPGRVLVPVAAVVALGALLPPVVSRSAIRSSQAAARAGDPREALRLADDAIETAPWSASAMIQKALLLEDAGELARAEGYTVLAMRREPTNWRYPLIRARLLAKRGDTAGAIRQFRNARALAPRKAALQ
jgi:tetratricopeptide (TPR) repeat protein